MTRSHTRARTTQPLLALLAAALLTLAVLVATRPRVSGGPMSWTADDLTLECLWWGAALASAWLTATTLACVVAVSRGRTRAAHRLARWAPPLARRVLQAALVSTWALVPAAAYAAAPTPISLGPISLGPISSGPISSGPIVVHVGADGRLTTGGRRSAPGDSPVVRTPATSTSIAATTTTSLSAPPVPSRRPAGVTTGPARTPPPQKHHIGAAGPLTVHHRVHIVRPGDNLWRIARAEVTRVTGVARPGDSQIAPYWQRVIAANRSTLRSGNPSLIFPGEAITLPPSN